MARVQKIKFQWFFDLATSKDSMQVITVSAGGQNVVGRLRPFFMAYKYYKLGKVKCTFVPASTLPVDPTGLSYDAGEPTVDPRDQLTPGMTRITNGEDFIDDISGISADDQTKLYNAMMMDPRWYKWQLQTGLKRSAYPKYWQIGQLHQDYFPGEVLNVPLNTAANGTLQGTSAIHINSWGDGARNTNVSGFQDNNVSDPRGIFQTGHKGRLGWMPTDALIHYFNSQGGHDMTAVAPIPCVELYKILLPRALKTIYYYRVYVTEEVLFSAPITIPQVTLGELGSPYAMMGLDRFVLPGNIQPTGYPDVGKAVSSNNPGLIPPNDGYGRK